MGILNVTPDSFSGDGLGTDVGAALRQAREMVEAGADVLDVGGESTAYWKAGYQPVSDEEELRRVLPVVARLRAELPATPISIDTRKPAVARAALAAGASWLNDVDGVWDDGSMADLAAEFGATFVIMYNARERTGRNIVDEVRDSLEAAAARALERGVRQDQIVVDPGFGFGNVPGHEAELVRGLPKIVALGYPVLVGPSRKRFIGRVLGTAEGDRVEGTAAVVALAVAAGVAAVRVHDVRPISRVLRMTDALVRAQPAPA
jgi:dihydropteroate synthase